jgi:hypothetical protein
VVLIIACASGPAAIVLRDSFDYPDGALTNVSLGKWSTHSGTAGEINVTAGQVELTKLETENVNAVLDGAPYSESSGAVLYAKFTVFITALPSSSGGYFAHFNASSSRRGRVFVNTEGAASGRFRFGVGNGSSSPSTNWPADLNLNQPYTVVVKYTVDLAETKLWVNPTNENSPSITAVDVATVNEVGAFSWRQTSGIGAMTVDDLVVGTTFDEAISGNESPTISNLRDRCTAQGQTIAIPFEVGDFETPVELLKISASALDSNIVQSIVVTNVGSNGTAFVTASGAVGSTPVSISVTDGTSTNSKSFLLTVLPSLVFADDFAYPDGALITNAAPVWTRYSGGTGEIQVVTGAITLATPLTEDVNTVLPYGPFTTNSGLSLYVSMHVNFSQLPGSSGDYFAHFNTNGTRCRLFVNSSNAAPGKFRMSIANASGGFAQQFPADLSLNTNYLVVLRYELATATSRLWINPLAETDLSTNAIDPAAPSTISVFAFRQSSNMGRFTIDDVKIGLTFAAVAGITNEFAPRLRIERMDSNFIRVVWPASAIDYRLQWNTDMAAPFWMDSTDLPSINGTECETLIFVGNDAAFFRLTK